MQEVLEHIKGSPQYGGWKAEIGADEGKKWLQKLIGNRKCRWRAN